MSSSPKIISFSELIYKVAIYSSRLVVDADVESPGSADKDEGTESQHSSRTKVGEEEADGEVGQRDEEEDEEWGEEEQEDLHTVLTMMMAVMRMMTTMVMSLEYSTCRQSTPLMRSPTAMPRAAATAGRMKTWQKIFCRCLYKRGVFLQKIRTNRESPSGRLGDLTKLEFLLA